MGRPRKYSPEIRERSVRMVFEHGREHGSLWAAIRSIASKLGCAPETLRKWVRQTERDEGRQPGLTTGEWARLMQLEREVKELRPANEMLRKASVRSTGQSNTPSEAGLGEALCHARDRRTGQLSGTSSGIAGIGATESRTSRSLSSGRRGRSTGIFLQAGELSRGRELVRIEF